MTMWTRSSGGQLLGGRTLSARDAAPRPRKKIKVVECTEAPIGREIQDGLWTEQGPLPNPCHSKRPIVWQVWLGANTPKRLANELEIDLAQACQLLHRAHEAGHIKRISRGVYSAIR